ncbi:MAG: S-layer homology domain-containing protein [Ruminococcaceae bacterium]|nr:S-layer homology domain-containing protein [Oscillospiraceae bacterium]
MNIFKRMASIALVAIMVLQVAVFAAPVPNDVIGTEYESAASMLCALDIMVGDGSNFNPDDNITRAEFAQIMMKSLALDSAAEAYQPTGMFTDVAKDNIFAPAIELGAGIGAIKGYGGGLFGPDDNVLGTEAVKMMVFAAGHDAVADGNGGYPTGYMSVAMDIGMLAGIANIDFTVPMTRGQAAILCANTLKVDMKKKITSGGEVQYVQQEGVSLLSEKHDTYMAEGIVSANELTELYTPSSLREGRVQISGDSAGIYIAGSTTIADVLGQYVKAYYTYDEDAGEGTIISYDIVEQKNDVQTTSLSNIEAGYTNALVKYWNDPENDIKPVEVEITTGTPAIILNGVSTTAALTTVLGNVSLLEGDITFIDSKSANGALGSDGKADVIIITAYDTIVVDKATSDEEGQFIKSKLNNETFEFDLNAPGVVSSVKDVDGNEMALEDVWAGDIISFAASDPGARQYVDMVISTESFEGTITEKSTKNGYDILTIDGEKYKISKKFALTSRYINDIKVGREAAFYTDIFGNIVYGALLGDTEGIFGILTQYVDGKGLDTSLKLRIFTEGVYSDISTASKVTVDGVICREPSAVKAALNTALANITTSITTSGATNGYYDESTTVTPLLYTLNEEGLITAIDTPYKNSSYESNYTLGPVKGRSDLEFITANYSSSSLTIEPRYTVTKTTPVVVLPSAFADLESTKKIIWGTQANLSQKDNKVQMFTTDPTSSKAMYVVAMTGASLDDWDNTSVVSAQSTNYFNTVFFVVSDVIEAINDEGDKTVMLTGLVAGAEKEYTVNADYFAESFKSDIWRPEISAYDAEVSALKDPSRASAGVIVGDVIRFKANAANEIVWVEPIYLSDVKIARSRDYANRPDIIASERKSAIDVSVVYKLEEDYAQVKSLITKSGSSNTGFDKTPTTRIITNANGFVVSAKSKDSAVAEDKTGWVLYDEVAGAYLVSNGSTITNGFAADQVIDLSKFPVTVFDASKPEGKQVYAGSINDIYDTDLTASRNKPASLIITQRRDSNPKSLYVIKF